MSKKTWIIFAVICVAVLAGLVYISTRNRVDVSGVDSATVLSATEQSGNIADHVYGKADSKVVFVEYGDYQCPGCKGAYEPTKAITEKYKDKIAFVFRNFPLVNLHPNARAAAAAGEAAGLQGKYWEMHDRLFETQDAWKSLDSTQRGDYFTDIAKELDLNTDEFNTAITSKNVVDKINFDVALGKSANITSTPTFYLNGEKIDVNTDNRFDSDKVSKLIEEKLKQ